MFWNHNSAAWSPIDILLAKEDVTLQEVLDSDDIINDCRVQNKSLIDYLQKSEIMEELVELTTKEPSPDLDERTRFKYPNIACELLTCDIPVLNERLASDKVLLEKLYTFLTNETPLNPLLASFFSKIMGALIAKKTEQNWLSYQFTCLQVLDFLKTKEEFLSTLLKHLGTSAIMDLMLKLFTQVETMEMRQNVLNWLDSQRVMQELVSLLNVKIDKERHYNAAQLLCDFIRLARDSQRNNTERIDPDPLLNTLESPETVSLLLDNIFGDGEKCESAIIGGIQVLLAILDVNQTSIPYMHSNYNTNINDEGNDIERKQKILQNTTETIRKRIKDFHNLLIDPPKKMPISTTVGVLDPPLGNTRLQVTKLFASLISSNNSELLLEIISLGTFPVLLDLFFKYSWNNFLHTQVECCLVAALKTNLTEETTDISNALCKHLLIDCKMIDRILEAWKENDEEQKTTRGVRQGYMGHLINIVNKLVEMCSTTSLGQYLKDNLPEVAKNLDDFKETTLSETNKITETLLGGVSVTSRNPNQYNDDNEDYDSLSNHAIQMFTQYAQMQNLTPQYSYSGFGDDAFNDDGDNLLTIHNRTETNLDLSDGDLIQQTELFKQVCAQNINTLDDADDQIFEDKDHTFQTVIEKHGGDRNDQMYSSDSDEDSPTGDDPTMDVDPWSSPDAGHLKEPSPKDPWTENDLITSNPEDVGGWADFASVAFETICSNRSNAIDEPTKIEMDLKIDNVEATEQQEEIHTIKEAATIKSTVVEKTDDICKNISETVVQDAAGDQGGINEADKQKESIIPVEPSKSTASVGDNCATEGPKGQKSVDLEGGKDNV